MNELKKRIKSFGYAFQGIASLLKKEHNAWIHCLAIVVVTFAGLYFDITRTEWCIVCLCFGMVLAAEALQWMKMHTLCLKSIWRHSARGVKRVCKVQM